MFQRMFSGLVGHKIVVELKNQVVLKGTLEHCDNMMNFKLLDIEILYHAAFPQLPRLGSATIRGSAICYIYLPPNEVNLERLHQESRELKSFTSKRR